MEGFLFIPPDRGTIIGRALWKCRYVVVGPARDVGDRLPPATAASSAQQAARPPPASPTADSAFLSIYKFKDDVEPVQQHAISSITDCQVQMIAHRKQGPVLPTLVISVSPDPLTDKLRKRRSSRTAGFATAKDASPTTLWFRPSEDNYNNHRYILKEWCYCIQTIMEQQGTISEGPTPFAAPAAPAPLAISAVSAMSPAMGASAGPSPIAMAGGPGGPLGPLGPLSPITPATPTFSNPFSASRHRDVSDASLHQHQHPQPPFSTGSGHHNARSSGNNHKLMGLTKQASQPPPNNILNRDDTGIAPSSPSLRSRRSDISHSSSNIAPHVLSSGANTFVLPMFPHRPAELPSPATTVAEYASESSENWVPPHGLSSAVSSPIRGRDSISSQPVQSMQSMQPMTATHSAMASGSPPAPRETILDRAFQMRFIPGSGREVPGEEKLSSLARFDALMREAEERKRLRQATTGPSLPTSSFTATTPAAPVSAPQTARPSVYAEPKSGWDLDEDSDEDSEKEEVEVREVKKVEEVASDEVPDANDSDEESLQARGPSHLDPAIQMTPKALRALDFITNRHSSGQAGGQRSLSRTETFPGGGFDAQTLSALDGSGAGALASGGLEEQQQLLLRPQTGYGRNRPAIAQRTHSQPQLAPLHINSYYPGGGGGRRHPQMPSLEHMPSPLSPHSFAKPSPSPSSVDEFPTIARSMTGGASKLHRASTSAAVTAAAASLVAPADKRPANGKRLSFSDFTKRISSGTNLLMSQTGSRHSNGSSTSRSSGHSHHHGPSAMAEEPVQRIVPPSELERMVGDEVVPPLPSPAETAGTSGPAGHTLPRFTAPPPPPPPADRCVWRGSVGVYSNEGGFL